VRKSLVLLKNGKTPGTPLLPLDWNAKKILVVGSHADDIGLQCGGWTIHWQGGFGDITPGMQLPQSMKLRLMKISLPGNIVSSNGLYMKYGLLHCTSLKCDFCSAHAQ
jgi:hypothetical protein